MELNLNNESSQSTMNDQNSQQQAQQQQQQSNQQQNQQPPYTIQGILHYLQYEWHRFELERLEWEVEKAELTARIALLIGEKKSHENLKHDLIRRIKMLEYCLRMERAKYHKLKHGTDPPALEDLHQSNSSNTEDGSKSDDGFTSGNNNSSTVTYGRELLKHYLQEIGYTDSIIDLRSNRVRSLLGMVDENQQNDAEQQQTQAISQTNNITQSNNSTELSDTAENMTGTKVPAANNTMTQPTAGSVTNYSTGSANAKHEWDATSKKDAFAAHMISMMSRGKQGFEGSDIGDAEASVMAKFGFLYDNDGSKDSEQADEDDEVSEEAVDAADRAASTPSSSEYSCWWDDNNKPNAYPKQKADANKSSNLANETNATIYQDANRKIPPSKNVVSTQQNLAKNWCPSPQKTDVVDIGELATLTTLGSESASEDYRRKQWTAKYRLQSHYDCVRALKFSDEHPLLVTASEDETIKLWHLGRQNTAVKSRQQNLPPSMSTINSSLNESSTMEVEPLYTYRGHTSRILCLAIHKKFIYSGAQNGELIMWKMLADPNSADQYDKFDSSLLVCKFVGHDDAVWAVEAVSSYDVRSVLVSASSDLTMKIWNTSGEDKNPLKVIQLDASPTCIAKLPLYEALKADIAISACDGKIRLYNTSTCLDESEPDTRPVITLEFEEPRRINAIASHPTLPYLASADSNHDIKVWDLTTERCMSTMAAHLDEVTSLACDPSGNYLLSGGHDCSARLWLFEGYTCIQEITSHRKKYDEGIFAVAFHSRTSHFATAGADGLAKVFV